MALRFVDSFDHYSAAQMARKWTAINGTAVIDAAAGRRGTSGLRFAGNGTPTFTKVLDAQATWVCGYNFKYSGTGLFSTPIFMAFQDGATTQVDLRFNTTTFTLSVTRNGTVLGTTAVSLVTGDQFIEFKATINATTGSYEVRINGVSVLSASGVNTRATANNTADRVFFNPIGLNAVAGSNAIDDLYICDGTGSTNNTFLGDVRVDAVLPSGAGANTGMTPSAGANYQCVDENPANDDTDYVQSDVVTTKDTYAFTDITHNPTAIFGVQVNMVARKDDAGARSICSVVRSGGADTDGATQALSTTYANYAQIMEQDPATSAAWTKTNLNAAEFGSKVAA